MEKEFGPAALKMAKEPTANINRFSSAVIKLQEAFGTYLLPTVSMLITDYFIPAMQYISENIDMFMGLAKAIGVVYMATKLYSVTVGIATVLTGGFSTAFGILNVIMSLNPIGIVVVALAALAGGIAYAWNTNEKFRRGLMGIWGVMKETGSYIYDYLVAPMMSYGKFMLGAFTFDMDLIKSGITDGVAAAKVIAERGALEIGNAFSRGYNKEGQIANFKKSAATNMGGRGSLYARTDAQAEGNANGADPTKAKGRAGLSGITGRSSQKNITINLGSLVQDLRISAATAAGGAEEMEAVLMRKLIQVINTANQAQ
jgi:phage-related protein